MATSCSQKNILEVHFVAEQEREIKIVDDRTLKEKIYFVRGQKVMLDSDLAEIYGYETKGFNRQVKRNIEKFEGEDFMFRLTDEEIDELSRCQNGTFYRTGYLYAYDCIKGRACGETKQSLN